MTFRPYSPGTLFLIDTSALARGRVKEVNDSIETLVNDGVAATCLSVDLEVVFTGRSAASVRRLYENRRELYTNLEINERIAERSRQVQCLMADQGLHRAAGPMDLITAAVAEQYGATILHYDADFEHIARVTGQQHRWIVPRGSID